MIYKIKQEGLYQNTVSPRLVYTCNYKMGFKGEGGSKPWFRFEQVILITPKFHPNSNKHKNLQ